jgi:hypothetical protein
MKLGGGELDLNNSSDGQLFGIVQGDMGGWFVDTYFDLNIIKLWIRDRYWSLDVEGPFLIASGFCVLVVAEEIALRGRYPMQDFVGGTTIELGLIAVGGRWCSDWPVFPHPRVATLELDIFRVGAIAISVLELKLIWEWNSG